LPDGPVEDVAVTGELRPAFGAGKFFPGTNDPGRVGAEAAARRAGQKNSDHVVPPGIDPASDVAILNQTVGFFKRQQMFRR
jgi:hypothetical protein